MKAYGLPRDPEIEGPDLIGHRCFALKSSLCFLCRNKDGDRHGSIRNSAAKRATRRAQKRSARREGRAACLKDIDN